MKNYFEKYTWDFMLNRNPMCEYHIPTYHKILCKNQPQFLNKYIALPTMQRLKGIGLLCGTDWTSLYHNRLSYSRLDHSIGVALITWNFTHDKKQTLAALFHDISTPVFSHVSDFRKGDALTQTATEEPNAELLKQDKVLQELLKKDGIYLSEINDYHKYPIADNEIPQLSADRLEYMFPSGMALDGSWTMEEIERCYNDIVILKNENNIDELGFKTEAIALEYCGHFCLIGHILQLNENKLTLQLLGKVMNLAVEKKVLSENDFMTLSEKEIIQKLEAMPVSAELSELNALYKTFRTMKQVKHTAEPLENHFCVSLKVKQRYINPLVKTKDGKIMRIADCSLEAKKIINDFLTYEDTAYGCVKIEK